MADPVRSAASPEAVSAAARISQDALARVLDAHQADRARLARFLHNEIAQFLSGIGLQLDILRMDFEGVSSEIAARTAEIQAVLEQLVQSVRDFSYGLNPGVVERAGLVPALDRLVGHYRRLFTGSIRLLASSGAVLTGNAAEAAYRIADLAVDNAIRHAGARKIEIVLRMSRKCPELVVRDDGIGFDLAQMDENSPGLGLLLMRRAAERGEVQLTIRSASGSGTSVTVRSPIA